MIEIREAKFSDVRAMREVAIQSFVDTFAEVNTPENMSTFLNSAYSQSQMEGEYYELRSLVYLACVGERIAGFLRLRVSREAEEKLGTNTIELHRLYVHKDFQNQKVGKMLMQKAIEYAVEQKFEWIWLGVWEHNLNAQRFYSKWGFEKFDEHVFQMGDDPQIDWLLKKDLKN